MKGKAILINMQVRTPLKQQKDHEYFQSKSIFHHVLQPKYRYKYDSLKSFNQHRNSHRCSPYGHTCHIYTISHEKFILNLGTKLQLSSVKYWILENYQPYGIETIKWTNLNYVKGRYVASSRTGWSSSSPVLQLLWEWAQFCASLGKQEDWTIRLFSYFPVFYFSHAL